MAIKEKEIPGAETAVEKGQRHRQELRPLPVAFALAFLALGIAHLAIMPGSVVDGRRYGWDYSRSLFGDNPLVSLPPGLVVTAAAVLCYVLGALRPLGVPLGPRTWLRWTIAGAVASLIVCALTWPGLEPSPLVFAVLPLLSGAVLAAWLARRLYGRGPLTRVERRIGAARKRRPAALRIGIRTGTGFATVLAILAVALGTWFFVPAYTPPIVDAQGNHVPGSIATLETIRLGGADQTILIRGRDTRNPVLLFLYGGPGGSAVGLPSRLWANLENHFTFVQWEQRGSLKSSGAANPTSALTVGQFVSDTIELSQQLRARFHQQQIYLLGDSWGTIIGVRAVQQRPDLYAAYIGVAQMVNIRETDRSIYAKLLEHAVQTGDTGLARTLRAQGPPPYTGSGMFDTYMNVATARDVFETPRSKPSTAYEQIAMRYLGGLLSPEYSLGEKLDWLQSGGISRTVFTAVYPQLQSFDFRRDAPSLKVPVYMILGQYDVNGTLLSADYFQKVQAPHKRLYIFAEAGHPSAFEQPERFVSIMVNAVLRET